MSGKPDDVQLDGFSYFGLVVFVAAMVPVLIPLSVPLGKPLTRLLRSSAVQARLLDSPWPKVSPNAIDTTPATGIKQPRTPRADDPHHDPENWRMPVNLTISPPLGVLLLLVTTSIDGSVIRQGVVGNGPSKPYDVIVLFISLAYIATALDGTGALRALAFYVSQRGGQSGPRLYCLLFLFFFACGVIFGNDPIILSGTAFLAYFTRVTGITPPTAWIFMEFIAANVASAVLVSSNPTNVLLAQAFELNFLTGYTKYTILPSLVCALVALPLLFLVFQVLAPGASRVDLAANKTVSRYIPAIIDPPDVSPRSALIDPKRAYFLTSLMVATLAVLVGTSFMPGVEVWMVTAPGGLCAFLGDLWQDWVAYRRVYHRSLRAAFVTHPLQEVELVAARTVQPDQASGNPGTPAVLADSVAVYPPAQMAPKRHLTVPAFLRALRRRFPTTCATMSQLPIPLLPFALSMFILVRSLMHLGWVSIFAGWMANVCTSPAATVFFVGFLGSLILCPLFGTNIGATILLVQIFSDNGFQSAAHVRADPRILKAAIFATALASNIGAFSFTFAASLAGLLWVRILSQKHVFVTASAFAGWNAVPVVVLTAVACLVVWLEVVYF